MSDSAYVAIPMMDPPSSRRSSSSSRRRAERQPRVPGWVVLVCLLVVFGTLVIFVSYLLHHKHHRRHHHMRGGQYHHHNDGHNSDSKKTPCPFKNKKYHPLRHNNMDDVAMNHEETESWSWNDADWPEEEPLEKIKYVEDEAAPSNVQGEELEVVVVFDDIDGEGTEVEEVDNKEPTDEEFDGELDDVVSEESFLSIPDDDDLLWEEEEEAEEPAIEEVLHIEDENDLELVVELEEGPVEEERLEDAGH